MTDELWRKIEIIVNKAARAVLKVRTLEMHVLDLYRVLDWLPARTGRDFQDLSLFWSIKHYKTPKNLSDMFQAHSETLPEDTSRRITRSITQNSINRSQENDSKLAIQATSFVPSMVKVFNNLDQEHKQLPDLRNRAGYPKSSEEKFKDLKHSLRNHVQWHDLEQPTYWPDREAALLDRGDEIYGLGILSETSSSEYET